MSEKEMIMTSTHLEMTKNGVWINYKNNNPIEFLTLTDLEKIVRTIKKLRGMRV